MFEVSLLLLAVLLLAASFFSTKTIQESYVIKGCSYAEIRAHEISIPENKFLEHLQNEVETTLFSRPTDSALSRHYNALVSAKLETRLALMPDS
jgi:hypothetical protein